MARRVQEKELKQSLGMQQHLKCDKHKFQDALAVTVVPYDAHYNGAYSLQYNYDGSELAAGFGGGGIILYDPHTGKVKRHLRPHRHGGYPVMCLRYHPLKPTLLYAATAEGHVYIINTETGEGADKPAIKEDKNQINTMDFGLDSFEFCTCGKDLAVRVYDVKTNKEKKTYWGYGANIDAQHMQHADLEAGNTMRVYSLKFAQHDENIFFTAGWDNHIKIWDIRTNDGIKRQIMGPHVCGDAMDINGQTILTGSWCANHALQEWDYREGKLIRDLNFSCADGAFLYCAQFASDETVLAGGSSTKNLQVIDRDENKHLATVQMDRTVMALDSSDDGRLFAVGGEDHAIKMCEIK